MTSALYDAISDAMDNVADMDTTRQDYAKAATEAAMKACGPRELVWMWNGNHWAGGHGYVIRKKPMAGGYTLTIRNQFDRNFDTIEAAKAAAQAHADAAHWANTVIGGEVGG